MKKSKHHKFISIKAMLVALLVLSIVAIGAIMFKKSTTTQQQSGGNTTNGQSNSLQDDTINFGPPTKQEQEETQNHKEKIANNPTSENIDGKKQVTPMIAYIDTESIGAYVPGIFEDGGVCTATLSKGASTISRSSAGFANASYTQCEPINITGIHIDNSWSVVVRYESTSAQGASEQVSISL